MTTNDIPDTLYRLVLQAAGEPDSVEYLTDLPAVESRMVEFALANPQSSASFAIYSRD